MSDDEHRLANAEPKEQPADLEQSQHGGTGVEQTTARFDSHIEVAAERAVEKAIANYPGEPRGELTITVTVTDK